MGRPFMYFTPLVNHRKYISCFYILHRASTQRTGRKRAEQSGTDDFAHCEYNGRLIRRHTKRPSPASHVAALLRRALDTYPHTHTSCCVSICTPQHQMHPLPGRKGEYSCMLRKKRSIHTLVCLGRPSRGVTRRPGRGSASRAFQGARTRGRE